MQKHRETLVKNIAASLYRAHPIYGGNHFTHTLHWCQVYAHDAGFGIENPVTVEDVFNSSSKQMQTHFLFKLFNAYLYFLTHFSSTIQGELLAAASLCCNTAGKAEETIELHRVALTEALQKFIPHFFENNPTKILYHQEGTAGALNEHPLLLMEMDDDGVVPCKVNPHFKASLPMFIEKALQQHNIFCEKKACMPATWAADDLTADFFSQTLLINYVNSLPAQSPLPAQALLMLLKAQIGVQWFAQNKDRVAIGLEALKDTAAHLAIFEAMRQPVAYRHEHRESQLSSLVSLLIHSGQSQAANTWQWLIELSTTAEVKSLHLALLANEAQVLSTMMATIMAQLLQEDIVPFYESLSFFAKITHQYGLFLQGIEGATIGGIPLLFAMITRLERVSVISVFQRLCSDSYSSETLRHQLSTILFRAFDPTKLTTTALMALFMRALSPVAIVKNLASFDSKNATSLLKALNVAMGRSDGEWIAVKRGHRQEYHIGEPLVKDTTITTHQLLEAFTEDRHCIANFLWDDLVDLVGASLHRITLIKLLCMTPASDTLLKLPLVFYIIASVSNEKIRTVLERMESFSCGTTETKSGFVDACERGSGLFGLSVKAVCRYREYYPRFLFGSRRPSPEMIALVAKKRRLEAPSEKSLAASPGV